MRIASRLPFLLAGTVVGAAILASGGSSDDRLVWIGSAAIAAAALLAWRALPGLTHVGALFLALLAAFVAWNGLSVLWSIAPDRSWDYLNRGAAYFAFSALGALAAVSVRRAPSVAAVGLACLTGAAVLVGLTVKVVPSLSTDEGRVSRLHTPVGYWNAFALLIDMALPAMLWIAARREHTALARAGGATLVFASLLALLLTYSRAGAAVGIVTLFLALLLVRPRLETATAIVLAGPLALVVAAWAFGRAGISSDNQPHSVRVHDGAILGVVVIVVATLVFALAWWAARTEARRPLSAERRQAVGRLGRSALVVAAVIGAIYLGVSAKPVAWYHDFQRQGNPTTTLGPQRLTDLGSSSRLDWWREAWRGFRKDPALGTGAASFSLTHHLLRKNDLYVTEPHSVPLQFLSETGIIGLLFLAGSLLAAAVATRQTVRRLEGGERVAATALSGGAIAWLLHASVDFDWDFVAVCAPFFALLGVLAASGRPALNRRRTSLPTVAVALVSIALVYSFVTPWLSRRYTANAFAAVAHSPHRALADARRAHELNPLALGPLFARAAAEDALGRGADAERSYVSAVKIQPLNWRPWYELGSWELTRDPRTAKRYLERSRQLDPYGLAARLIRQVPTTPAAHK